MSKLKADISISAFNRIPKVQKEPTQQVYTHFEIQALLEAINKI